MGTSKIKNSSRERLSYIDMDYKLNFENHIDQTCIKTREKIKALETIAPFLNKEKRKLLMSTFCKSRFSYCSLSWIFHSRTLSNKIHRLPWRYLLIIYNDNPSSFTKLLEWDNSVSVHDRKIQLLLQNYTKFLMVYFRSWSVFVLN